MESFIYITYAIFIAFVSILIIKTINKILKSAVFYSIKGCNGNCNQGRSQCDCERNNNGI